MLKIIMDWLRESFDLASLMIFITINAYLLFIDLPSLERQKIQGEAKIIKYLGWGGIASYLGLIILHILG